LRPAGKSGYYTDDSLPTVAALCEQANEQLFRSIKYLPTHSFPPLLPFERSTPYCTRLQPHNYELLSKINNIDECNFMYRVLYKDCFSCFYHVSMLCFVFNNSVSVDYFNKDYYYHHHLCIVLHLASCQRGLLQCCG